MEGIGRMDPGGCDSRTSQLRQQSLLATRYLKLRKANYGRDYTGSRKGNFIQWRFPRFNESYQLKVMAMDRRSSVEE